MSLKKLFDAAEDVGAFAEELTTTAEEDCGGTEAEEGFAKDEVATVAEELLATFTEEEDAGTAAYELARDFAEEELATFVEEELAIFFEDDDRIAADEAGFAAEEDKNFPGTCIVEELVNTMCLFALTPSSSEQPNKASARDAMATNCADFFNNINTPYS